MMNSTINTPGEESINVFIVENHGLQHKALASFIQRSPGLSLCGEAPSAEEALVKLPDCAAAPHIVLVNIILAQMNGFSLIRHLLKQHPCLSCIAISGLEGKQYAARALAAGAQGYVTKDDLTLLPEVIRTVYNGQIYLSNAVKQALDIYTLQQ